jgi:hypothetical protein
MRQSQGKRQIQDHGIARRTHHVRPREELEREGQGLTPEDFRSSVLTEIPPLDPASPVLKAYSCYRSLIQKAESAHCANQDFGGKLLYLGELDDEGRAIAIAGNVAGCATLCATADPAAQKQAIRDGIVDFLVTSLDEALRILKNEIRKHATVAVCVAISTMEIEREMLERGVEPDLCRERMGPPGRETERSESMRSPRTVVWQVESSPAKWLPKLDTIALECLDPADGWNRRWIRLSQRYLNRVAPNRRIVHADQDFAGAFLKLVESAFDRGEFETAATILMGLETGFEEHHFPSTRSGEVVTPRVPPPDSKAP